MQQPSIQTASPPRDRLLRLPEVIAMTGLAKSTIYGQVKAGCFPPSVLITRRAAVWSERAVQAWIQERLSQGVGK